MVRRTGKLTDGKAKQQNRDVAVRTIEVVDDLERVCAEVIDGLPERLETLINLRFDGEKRKAARAAKIDESGLYRALDRTKKRVPSFQDLLRLAFAAKVPPAWLLFGQQSLQIINADELNEKDGGDLPPGAEPVPGGRMFIFMRGEIPELQGSHSEQLEVAGQVAFQADWVREYFAGLNIRELQLIQIAGDHLAPTIRAGDLLVIDRSIGKISENGIYALLQDNDIVIRRLQLRIDKSIEIVNDNPAYRSSEIVPAAEVRGLTVLGRVVWRGTKSL